MMQFFARDSLLRVMCLSVVLSVGGCGGGGGGGGSSSGDQPLPQPPLQPLPPLQPPPQLPLTDNDSISITNPDNPPTVQPLPPQPRPQPLLPTQRQRLAEPSSGSPAAAWVSVEYNANRSLSLTNTAQGYALRTTGLAGGENVVVAVIDSGIDRSHPELVGSIRSAVRVDDADSPHFHGTFVAGIIAAARNGRGMHGIAYNAQIVAMQATIGTLLHISAIHRLMREAAGLSTNGVAAHPDFEADIINLSVGWREDFDVIRTTMRQIASTGKIVVISAGNDDQIRDRTNPNMGPYPASYVIDRQVAGLAIKVGALNRDGTAGADFSNICGEQRDYCLFAPGQDITSTTPGGYGRADGTSFAAPLVSGALAVLMAAFPSHPSRSIVARLLTTADDLAPGGDRVDETYGWGAMNLQEAMTPQGVITLALTNARRGTHVALQGTQAILAPSISTALAQSSALESVLIHDRDYFQFYTDLRHVIDTTSFDDQFHWFFNTPLDRPWVALYGHDGHDVSRAPLVSVSTSTHHPVTPDQDPIRLALRLSDDTRLMLFHDVGLLPQDASRQTFMRRSMLDPTMYSAPFQTLASTGSGLSVSHNVLDNLSVAVSYLHDGQVVQNNSQKTSLGTVAVDYQVTERLTLSVNGGNLDEQQRLLGSAFKGAFGNFDSQTMFIGVGTTLRLFEDISLFGHYSQGYTRGGTTSGLITHWSDITSDAFGVGVTKHALFDVNDDLTFMVSQPLRVRSGEVTVTVPTADDRDGVVTQTSHDIPLKPSGQEITLQLGYQLPLPSLENSSVTLGGYTRFSPNHDAQADPEIGLGMRLTLGF